MFDSVKKFEHPSETVWYFTNEQRKEVVLSVLAREPAKGDTFIGTGCFFALDAYSVRPKTVDHLVVIDISSKVASFWGCMKEIIVSSTYRLEAQRKVMELFRFHDFQLYGSFLSEDVRFLKVQKLFMENKFNFLSADFVDAETLISIGSILKESGRKIDTVYESNIGSFHFEKTGGWDHFRKFVRHTLVESSMKEGDEMNFMEVYAIGGARGADYSVQYHEIVLAHKPSDQRY